MSDPDPTPDRLDETGPLQDVVRYVPGILAVVLTVGVSVGAHLPVSLPSLKQSVLLAGIPAVAIALLVSRSDWDPSGSRFLALAGLAWAVFSLSRIPLLDAGSARIDGSVYVLADLALVWLGSYLASAAVVYGIEWPTPHVSGDGDVDAPDPDPADD